MVAPLVSVVIPTYNAAWSIGRTLDSILAQRFKAFEIILVDDGSTDDLKDRLLAYADEPRLRVVRQANGGLANARNRGISEASAPLVAPIDADDVWHPDFLELAVAALDAEPDAPFAFAASFRMDETDRILSYNERPHTLRHDLVGMIWRNLVGNGSAAVYRRVLVQEAGGFDETMRSRDLQGAEDYKLILALAAKGTPVFIPRSLVGYRYVRKGMSQGNPARQLRAVLAVMDEMQDRHPEVARRHWRDGRALMQAIYGVSFLRAKHWGLGLRTLVSAYVGHPLFLLNPSAQALHREHLAGFGRASLSMDEVMTHHGRSASSSDAGRTGTTLQQGEGRLHDG
ncbi:glycosyltransferase family A protein [Parvularcula sp. LCG005]|uniref:glycosyltransferase family 2 protein n=1 Tax=Parvularcula sp. LCG005 TaxID=3078805 RepID=UPI0029437D81|nr:glycosyltransferase family A protein [Parvularcula sp. LCG005]WOI54050.1 glycosyltransferase family A protein [Parvularcula sp. LCG005]